MSHVWCSRLVVLLTAFGCVSAASHAAQPVAQEAGTSPIVLLTVTDQTVSDTPYYLKRPAQSDSPDGVFKRGTKVQRLSRIPQYSRVRSRTGIEAFVSTSELRPYRGKPDSPKAFTFSADKITQLRKRVRKALAQPAERRKRPDNDEAQVGTQPSESRTSGWTTTTMDPMKIVGAFKPLSVKRGYILRGYLFVWGLNSNGIVWALPVDAEFPPPERSPQKNRRATPPKPPAALENVMDAIEGDQSPWSYLCASVLSRELREFGARWHGIAWGDDVLLGADPFRVAIPTRSMQPSFKETLSRENWTWSGAKPENWKPRVRVESQRVVVTFYTYNGRRIEGIYRHADTYQPDSYRSESTVTRIASGKGGYLY